VLHHLLIGAIVASRVLLLWMSNGQWVVHGMAPWSHSLSDFLWKQRPVDRWRASILAFPSVSACCLDTGVHCQG
jgi:hypothetical protein